MAKVTVKLPLIVILFHKKVHTDENDLQLLNMIHGKTHETREIKFFYC